MGMIAKTLTKGFRTSFFRNQPVHQFYGHLQAVLKDIDPSGQMNSLFARPETSASNSGEIEWSTELSGDPISFKDLPAAKQQEVAGLLSTYIEKIRAYADAKQGKTGIEKDYAEYLKAVAMSPDLNQVFVVNNRPVLVHWGFVCDSGNHPGQGIYAGWDEFIAQVQRKAEKKPEPAPKPVAEKQSAPSAEQAAAAAAVFAAPPPEEKPAEKTNEKTAEKKEEKVVDKKTEEKPAPQPEKKPEKTAPKKDDPNQEKPLLALGLGAYRWVKWLAIVLAIIILLLLLLKILVPRNPMGGMGMPPGMSAGGGSMPSLQDLLGGMPGGNGGLPGGDGGMPGMPGGSGGKNGGQTPHICPHCGHSIDDHQSGQPTPPKQQQPQQQPKPQQPQTTQPTQTSEQPTAPDSDNQAPSGKKVD